MSSEAEKTTAPADPAETPPAPPPASRPTKPGFVVRLLRVVTGLLLSVVLPLAVIGAGVHFGQVLLENPPKAKKRVVERRAPLANVRTLKFTSHPTNVAAMGTVVPSRIIELRPRVAGEVVETSPELVRGGRFAEGDVILRIDRTDYELAVRQREADLAAAESALRIEEGQQAVARREFELLGADITDEERDLMLRKPQIAAAHAQVDMARAALERAHVDLERTVVHAPFNALVRTYDVDMGTQIGTSTRIATLEATDTCYIEVSVPVDRLGSVRVPRDGEAGASVLVFATGDTGMQERAGRVLRLVGDLEPSGRMARLLVGVDDPFSFQPAHAELPRLLYGSYVRVVIAGPRLDNAAAIDRTALRNGDVVWIADAENRLRIRPVTVAYRTHDCVLVTEGVAEGDRLVVSDLPTPSEGMELQVEAVEGPDSCDTGTASDER